MIDLRHKFALLANGTIEPLYYYGEMRMAYQEDGKYYLDHDVWFSLPGFRRCCAYRHDEIVRTANSREDLEQDPICLAEMTPPSSGEK